MDFKIISKLSSFLSTVQLFQVRKVNNWTGFITQVTRELYKPSIDTGVGGKEGPLVSFTPKHFKPQFNQCFHVPQDTIFIKTQKQLKFANKGVNGHNGRYPRLKFSEKVIFTLKKAFLVKTITPKFQTCKKDVAQL